MIYLSENADSDFAKTSAIYLDDLPEEIEKQYPKLLGAKALLYSYQMKVEQSNSYIEKLKQQADKEQELAKTREHLKAMSGH